ncbi:glycosyltransferase family 2 protein [Sphingomonas montana]|uniref:glycosyltransferase family 2 protein n=1 Tax=Sphingomonas montana TaxID=1843236 RepID=UPI0019D1C88F|nr:galactosyltransferase-related protein [Sphingomonas montana]
MRISVLTLVRGRRAHLERLMAGLAQQTRLADEFVIAFMEDATPGDLPALPLPVRTVLVPGDPMPLARARNRAVATATGDLLILLDVDCIPTPTLVESYARAAESMDAIFLGEVRYLPAGAVTLPLDYAALGRLGRRHPAKPAPPETGIRAEADHGELWGLSFALSRSTWERSGGMDERYVGYGGEETDFAASLAAAAVPMFWVGGARAYHQHHSVHIPPYQHFDPIVRNAMLFRAKWGRWCMDYWLGQFVERGLIAVTGDRIAILRHPTADEIAAARQPDDILFS